MGLPCMDKIEFVLNNEDYRMTDVEYDFLLIKLRIINNFFRSKALAKKQEAERRQEDMMRKAHGTQT